MRLNENSLVCDTKLGSWARGGNGEGGLESASSSLWLPGEGYCFPEELGLVSSLLLTPKVAEGRRD